MFIVSGAAKAPVVFDAAGTQPTPASKASFSWPHVVVGNCLIVFATLADSSTSASMTCTATPSGGSAITVPLLTSILSWTSFGTDHLYLFAFGVILSPASYTIATTTSGGSGTGGQATAPGSVSYANVGSIGTAVKTSSTTSATSITQAVAVNDDNDMVAACWQNSTTSSNVMTPVSGQNSRYSKALGSNTNSNFLISDAQGNITGSVNMGITQPTSAAHADIAVPLLAA